MTMIVLYKFVLIVIIQSKDNFWCIENAKIVQKNK